MYFKATPVNVNMFEYTLIWKDVVIIVGIICQQGQFVGGGGGYQPYTTYAYSVLYLNELVIDKEVRIKPDVPFKINFETRIVNFKWYDEWDQKDEDVIKFRAIISDVDIGAGHTNTLGTQEVEPDIIESLSQGLDEAGSIAISGTITDTLSAANCEKAAYICITYSNSDEDPFLIVYDWYQYDNTLCRTILDQTLCSGGNCLTSFSGEYLEDRHLCYGYANNPTGGGLTAQRICRSDLGIPDAEVAEIVDDEVKLFLEKYVFPDSGETWIGFIESGTGTWLSGSPVTWTDWRSGHSQAAGYTCVSIQNDGRYDHQWESQPCTNADPTALCQFVHMCSTNPCNDRGRCVPDGKDAYRCECLDGYTGRDCLLNFDHCEEGICGENGICITINNTYTCICKKGYEGDQHCDEIDECAATPCVTGGTCTDLVDGYKCTCPGGYTGPRCYTDVRECVGRTCNNHGVCVDGIDSWHCVCFGDWTGDECEIPIEEDGTVLQLDALLNEPWYQVYENERSPEYQTVSTKILKKLVTDPGLNSKLGSAYNKVHLSNKENSLLASVELRSPHHIENSKLVEALQKVYETTDGTSNSLDDNFISVDVSVTTDGEMITANQDIRSLCGIYNILSFCKEGSTCENHNSKAKCSCLGGWTGEQCDEVYQEDDDTLTYLAYILLGLNAVLTPIIAILLIYTVSKGSSMSRLLASYYSYYGQPQSFHTNYYPRQPALPLSRGVYLGRPIRY